MGALDERELPADADELEDELKDELEEELHTPVTDWPVMRMRAPSARIQSLEVIILCCPPLHPSSMLV
jgi:hypothetical protein